MTAVKKIGSALLIATAAVGIGLALALFMPQSVAPGPTPPADTAIHSGRLPGYENAPANTTPEYFWYLYNGSLSAAADGSIAVMLENTPGNECSMRVRYTMADDTILLTTPIIGAGEHLLYAYPEVLPQPGSYPLTVTIQVYHTGQDPATEEPFATYTEQAQLTIPKGAALTQKEAESSPPAAP